MYTYNIKHSHNTIIYRNTYKYIYTIYSCNAMISRDTYHTFKYMHL